MAKTYEPRMHSAEHILNQVMVRKFNCGRCFSAHINKKRSKCDYHFDRALSEEEVKEIEAEVNNIISARLEVTKHTISLAEAERDYNINRLPKGVENVRIVCIGDFDFCPCIGEHVNNTSEIGSYSIVSQDFNNGVLRIRYSLEDPS